MSEELCVGGATMLCNTSTLPQSIRITQETVNSSSGWVNQKRLVRMHAAAHLKLT